MTARPDWNLGMVYAREARAMLPRTAAGAIDWGDVRVGHLDTGYTRSPVFGDLQAGQSWLRPDLGLNLVDGTADPLDPLNYEGNPGHGTRTLSVICGDAKLVDPVNESEIGVAPGLPVVPVRVVNSVVLIRERHREAVAEGIRHAVAQGCRVISISLGVPFFAGHRTGGLGKAVDRAYEAGVIIAAAGGQVIDRVTYPGKYNRTIGVGGVTWQRRVWFAYEQGQEMIDVWAPAEDVPVADRHVEPNQTALAPVEGDDPGSFDVLSGSSAAMAGSLGLKLTKSKGTSFATAHVAAAAAMWLRLRGADLNRRYDEPWQRVEAFRRLLRHRNQQALHGQSSRDGARVLTIDRLLDTPLPDAGSLVKAPEDDDKSL